MCDGIMIIMFLCIFDCYECCALLERFAICAFCRTMCDSFMDLKRIRMQRLHRTSGLVAEVQCTLVGPLRSAFDTAIEA